MEAQQKGSAFRSRHVEFIACPALFWAASGPIKLPAVYGTACTGGSAERMAATAAANPALGVL